MPFFFKFSLGLLLSCLALGQTWLHGDADQGSVVAARDAVASCPSVGATGPISTSWDVIRTQDAVRVRRLAALAGIGGGC